MAATDPLASQGRPTSRSARSTAWADVSPGLSAGALASISSPASANRDSTVLVVSHDRPPSQPDTFGGLYGSWPIASRKSNAVWSRMPSPIERYMPATYTTGGFTMFG